MSLTQSLQHLWSRLIDTSNDDKKIPNYLLLVPLIVFLIILIFIGIKIFLDTRPNPYGDSVKLPELSREIPGLTRDETNLILHNVYNALAQNSSDNDVTNKKGTIRTGSANSTYSDTTKIHSGTFIIDFPSERQSFQVSFEYAKKPEGKKYLSGYNVIVSCLTDPSQIIYEDQVCLAVSPVDSAPTPDQKLLVNLPYTGTTPSGNTFHILSRHYSNGDRYYEVAVNSCGNQDILNSALVSAKSWIKDDLGLDPDLFTFEVPSSYCPGGIH